MKLTLVRFVNTAIVPIVVSRNTSDWFGQDGLITNMFYIMISLAVVNNTLYIIFILFIYYRELFDFGYFFKFLKRKAAGPNSKMN